MTQEIVIRTPKEVTKEGMVALRELKTLITRRPQGEKLVINGKQYLYFSDWQLLGAYLGITARVVRVTPLTAEVPVGDDGKFTKIITIGYQAEADAIQSGKAISSAIAICLKEESNWKGKELFAILSMAETRAMAKALRNVLQWVVKLPDNAFPAVEIEADAIAEDK